MMSFIEAHTLMIWLVGITPTSVGLYFAGRLLHTKPRDLVLPAFIAGATWPFLIGIAASVVAVGIVALPFWAVDKLLSGAVGD